MTLPFIPNDPYIFLEDLNEENEAWANKLSAETLARFGAGSDDSGFEQRRADLYEILAAKDNLVVASKRGEHAYNFYIDGDHPRGLWRRTKFTDYLNWTSADTEPEWEILLDVSALCEAEGESWVFGGASVLRPDYKRAIVSLHPGGSDTNVNREFDLESKSFVPTPADGGDGFYRPNAKGSLKWVDADTVITDSVDDFTASGYPRKSFLWKRGTDIAEAIQLVEGEVADVLATAYYDSTEGYEKLIAFRATDFRTTAMWDVQLDDGEVVSREILIPRTANVGSIRDWAVAELRHDWILDGTTYEAGSLLAVPYSAALEGPTPGDIHVLYAPTAASSLVGMTALKSGVVFTTLDNVKTRVWYGGETVAQDGTRSWTVTELHPDVPEHSVIGIGAVDSEENDDVWVTTSGFLTPTTLSFGSIDASDPANPTLRTRVLRQAPARFDATGLEVRQRWATSDDGTQVPYFVVGPTDALDGKRPVRTLLDGYGGFEIPELPSYIATYGKVWLEKGYVYALSNIRGGGEFGPAWHQAALKENRNKAYEDHSSVARDLVKAGITTVGQLAATGGSNGGLLMGNMYTTYPDLFGAIVCRVPLLDMKRYSHLLAGASWVGEYGDPDTDDWDYIQKYSAYHHELKGDYPPILITTSTRDDRVHPGHARKFYQKIADAGLEAYYHENTEGGHAGAADIKQRALMTALIFSFLDDVLAD